MAEAHTSGGVTVPVEKKLSNPFSTGGGGAHFEAHVQSSYVTLMLTGGYAPCLPCWPISKIKLQGKIDGFETDDLIVFIENQESKEKRKLLGQVKHSISITKKNPAFSDVIQAAWKDFHNPKIFTKGKDVIALITGPLTKTDADSVLWLLNQAKHTENADDFIQNVKQANFSPPKSSEKLSVIKHHLKIANRGNDVSKNDLYTFLKHFYLLGYDLGSEHGVVLSLLHSHISQFQQQSPQYIWSRIVDIVQSWNHDAGTITLDNLPEDLKDVLRREIVTVIPEKLKDPRENSKISLTLHTAACLSLALLIGSWDDSNNNDIEVVTHIMGIHYEDWLQKTRELLHLPDSPLTLINGIWKIVNRPELLNLLGSHILDRDLDTFKSLAVKVLSEPDPAFELPSEERYLAKMYGKRLSYSRALRKGIAEGLALIGNFSSMLSNCSHRKVENICELTLQEILSEVDHIRWGSLNNLLPIIAEAAPRKFISLVEETLHLTPCPFDELFFRDKNHIFIDYLPNLLWALEGLAWEEQYLVSVCDILGELASHGLDNQWTSQVVNSLVTILLPWIPQTLASIEKRRGAVRTLIEEYPNIAWDLIIKLLPGQHQVSSGSHQPIWRKIIPDGWKNSVTHAEYWQQVSFYAELSVSLAGYDPSRLSTLIDNFDNLPKPAFDKLIETLSSETIVKISEDKRLSIWHHLVKFIKHHRYFSDSKQALSEELIIKIEAVAKKLAPTDPFNLHQHLFTNNDLDFYDKSDNWEERQKKLTVRREAAILEVYQQKGIAGVVRFAELVESPRQVGEALGGFDNNVFEETFLPSFLSTENAHHNALVSSFIWRRFSIKNWDWCNGLDKSIWSLAEIGEFLTCLPFSQETWSRASEWLQNHEDEYWTRVESYVCYDDDNLPTAIEKLIGHGRPYAAINLLHRMLLFKQSIDTNQCVQALLLALSSNEENSFMNSHKIVKLIKFLQKSHSANEDDLFKIEWAYLRLLDHSERVSPQLLENRLANNPDFFCEIISLAYRSEKEKVSPKELTKELQSIAEQAWWLLNKWETPPGTQKDGTFDTALFTNWLQKVKKSCLESGHSGVALNQIGKVLIYAPADSDKLWINKKVASALNNRDAENMRKGFNTGIYNSRGIHSVDPSGSQEKKLAELWRQKADEIENEGFQRFAVTLRRLADGYDKEAELVIAEHKQ